MDAPTVLNREFLEVRARLLEIAAALDRIDRAGGAADDPRWERLQQGIDLLHGADAGRAEKVQLLFSREYDAAWKGAMKIERRG